jgi:hypothetical protein
VSIRPTHSLSVCHLPRHRVGDSPGRGGEKDSSRRYMVPPPSPLNTQGADSVSLCLCVCVCVCVCGSSTNALMTSSHIYAHPNIGHACNDRMVIGEIGETMDRCMELLGWQVTVTLRRLSPPGSPKSEILFAACCMHASMHLDGCREGMYVCKEANEASAHDWNARKTRVLNHTACLCIPSQLLKSSLCQLHLI